MLKGRRIPEALAFAALLASVVQVALWYPKLPARLATSFDAVGRAQADGPKSAIFSTLFAAVFVYGLISLSAVIISRVPTSWLNAPYPLTEDNLPRFMALMQEFISWIKAWTELICCIVVLMVINAATSGNQQFLGTMGVYALVAVVVVTIVTYVVRIYRLR